MKRTVRLMSGLLIVGLALGACSPAPSTSTKEAAITIEEQASGLKQLTLSAHAAERLGIQTAPVTAAGSTMTVPYAAVIYDNKGATWTYVNTQPLVYLRETITVDEIDGDLALISAGPASGTQVVTTGAAELYGAEIGVGGGH